MDLYTLKPTPLTVSYPGVLPLGSSSFTINVEEDSALVALYMDSILYGAAYSSGGEAVVNLNPVPTEEGFMHITITKHNYATYEDSIPAIIPASVAIEPDTISVNTPEWVHITVLDDNSKLMSDVEVSISGYGVRPPLIDTTNTSGICSLKVDALYGEALSVRRKIIGGEWMLFDESLWVIDARDFTSVSLSVSVPSLDLTDTLAPYYEGLIDASVSPLWFRLFVTGCGIDTSSYYDGGYAEMVVVPKSSGEVTLCIADTGYNIYEESYPVKEFYGTLYGTVRDSISSSPICGALVRIYDIPTKKLVFDTQTGDNGMYVVSDSLPVGDYEINVRSSGYEEYCDTFMLLMGEHTEDVYMKPSVGVDEDIPRVYALYQNAPNPFWDATTIRYALPRKGRVSLEVYNVLGQRVSVLESGVKQAGFYDVKWDGRDSRGMKVSGGIYFVRFSSGDFHSIKKIVKLR
jgi:hypothetical protein